MKADAVVQMIEGVQPGKYHLVSADADGVPYAVVCIVGVSGGDAALQMAARLSRAVAPLPALDDGRPLIER